MPAARYWRAIGLESYGGGELELSALHLYAVLTRVDATATLTSTHAPLSGALANLQDTDLNTVTRFDTNAPLFALQWDFGSGNTADITLVVAGSSNNQAEFLSSLILQYSSNTYVWDTLDTFGQYAWPGANMMVDVIDDGGDTVFTKVSLLLHGDGVNTSTDFTDSSSTPKLITAFGNATISTAQSKFGGAAMYFDGAGDYLRVAADVTLNFGQLDYTIEAWLNVNTIGADQTVFSQYTSWATVVAFFTRITKTGKFKLYAGDNIPLILESTIGITAGQWNHVAISRTANTTTIFINGVAAGSSSVIANMTSTSPLGIGYELAGNAEYFSGYMDDIRFTKGVGRYTANFTPPALAFQNQILSASIFDALPRPILNEQQFLSWPGSTPPSSGVGNAPNDWVTAYDPYHGGAGRIVGTVKEKNLPDNSPLVRKVWLMDEASKMVIRETWSDVTTGDYEFTGIRMGTKYTVLSYDHTGAYRAVIADNQEATL